MNFCFYFFFQACMILSSLYHTFTCHSQQWSENCLTLDLIGITMALLATYLSGIYYAFWCAPFWRDFYLTTVGGLFILATMAQFFPGFADEKNSHYRIGKNSMMTSRNMTISYLNKYLLQLYFFVAAKIS